MSSTTTELVGRLADADRDTRALALGELIGRGAAAVPELVGALGSPSAQVRALAAEGLSALADPSSADALYRALGDPNERVRAHAARGLAHIGDSRTLEALLRTINDAEDVLHTPHTVSTYGLQAYGPHALPALAPLLKDPDPRTRRRAFAVVTKLAGDILGAQGSWSTLQASLGSYDPLGPQDERDSAADQWAAWIRTHVKP